MEATTTAAEIAEAWGLTLEGLEERLGPKPNAAALIPNEIGERIVKVLTHRAHPMSAAALARAVCRGKDNRQAVYRTANRMVKRGLIRRPRHGYYERIFKPGEQPKASFWR